ncbi:hypothetical protein C8F04DRAFT_1194716 [Mycena alexandri]|uniref:Uncharacterized protein n=1 Tax=Mycena alexandri TaxID=1745969 RepID=A0AAD6S8P4_9AGAR|nr:hypothetical protein C8F04DRAFT_1194716 [Mycena alexandri]
MGADCAAIWLPHVPTTKGTGWWAAENPAAESNWRPDSYQVQTLPLQMSAQWRCHLLMTRRHFGGVTSHFLMISRAGKRRGKNRTRAKIRTNVLFLNKLSEVTARSSYLSGDKISNKGFIVGGGGDGGDSDSIHAYNGWIRVSRKDGAGWYGVRGRGEYMYGKTKLTKTAQGQQQPKAAKDDAPKLFEGVPSTRSSY